MDSLVYFVLCLSFAAAQFETGSQSKPDQWFWNSTTETVDSQTADDSPSTNETITTPSTIASNNETVDDSHIFPPANSTSGRSSSLLAELFSDDFVPANVTRGRSSKAMNLDLIGNVREGRILNEDPGNRRLSLQGFIPIVSFSGKEDSAAAKSPKRIEEDDHYYNSNGPYPPIPLDDEEQTKSENFYSPVSTTTTDSHRQAYQKAIQPSSYGQRIQDKHHNYYIPPPSQQQNQQTNQKNKEKYAVVTPPKEVVRYVTAEDYHKRPIYQEEPAKNQQDQFQQDAVNAYLKNLQEQYLNKDPQKQQDSGSAYLKQLQDQYNPQNSYQKPQQDQYNPQNSYQKPQQDQYNPYQKPQEDPFYQQNSFNKHQDPVKSESQPEGHFIISSNQDGTSQDVGPTRSQTSPARPSQDTSAKQFGQEGLYELSDGNYILSEGGEEDKCICVPFYLCRNGYLTNYGRSLEKDDIDERSARKVSKRNAGNESETRDEKTEAETFAPYTEDIMARMIGLNNVGDSCGLLRRCCRVPRRAGGDHAPLGHAQLGGLLPFAPDNYPLPPHPQQLPPGFTLRPGNGGDEPASFVVNPASFGPAHHQDQYQSGHHQPQGHTQVILVPQEVPQQPHRRPRPVFPHPKPPQSHFTPPKRPANPNRSVRPHYPQRPTQEPVYQPQPSYPHPQPAYPPPGLRPPKPDFDHHLPQQQGGQCGARNGFGIHGRVNNLQYTDDASEFGEYPWQAAILLKVGPGNNLFVCGGTLISSQWVATAAHCLKKHNADELKVRLGDWDVHRDDEFYPYVEKLVVEAVVHPDFYPGNLQNDLALLRLEAPVDPSLPHISPACLPEQNERFDNLRCWVTGWGKNAFGEQGEYQSVLKEVDIPMVSHRDCEHRLKQTRLGRSYNLHPGFVCAGGEPGKDACTGDGGSPLVCDHGGSWKVAGLVSWGIGCGQPGVPGIYVNMAKYRGWIDTVTRPRYG